MKRTVAMLLAGGRGTRLNILARLRAKPAVPFGGIYRIIDFTLSNIANSNILFAGILTQYKPYSLMKHIDSGVPWDFIGRNRSVKILPPATGEKESDWYKGTADAIFQNLSFITQFDPEYTLVLSGDHIYYMDYNSIIDFHKEKNADVTVGMMEVPIEIAHHFGIGLTNKNQQIIEWEEKPARAKSNLASMGIYVFNTKFLHDRLHEKIGHDFGNDIIPILIPHYRIFSFPFKGYWQDVGTIQAYWETNMAIIEPNSRLNLKEWKIRTNVEEEGMIGDRTPSYIGKNAKIINSLISPHCIIEGNVTHSILSPGVHVEKGAVIRNSIVMHDSRIQKNSQIDFSIIDKNCIIEENGAVGFGEACDPNEKNPDHLNSGISVIGKDCVLPRGLKVGKNCIIHPHVKANHFHTSQIKSGSTIEH